MWIDIHAHLYEYSDQELETVLTEAQSAGVEYIVSTAVSIETSAVVVHQCQTFHQLFGAAGISPFDVTTLNTTWFDDLSSLLKQKKIIAIGEIGIDNSNPRYPHLDQQLPVFEKQLELAVAHDLPVIIHSRGIEQTALEICVRHTIKNALFHCYTGDASTLKNIVDAGYMVSFSGIVTFNKSNLHELVQSTPLSQLFIETDSPYLTPVPFRGRKNTPAMVKTIGEKIAEIRSISPQTLQEQLSENFKKIFRNRKV
ncbi:MAG TPA: TatD family hydrolase [Chitinispirillaceae bacterium]|nr:TatD family hydrolase [Chitinispirillaceae bacterium]